ncbi:MAG: hypothetical protein AAB413_02505 [Patescibacteria group bacterium]
MIYLVGGAPRTGKSIISNILMKGRSVPWLRYHLPYIVRKGEFNQENEEILAGLKK